MSEIIADRSERLPILQTVRALALMRNALVLLDEVGESATASHLQFAIDTLDQPQSVEPKE